MIGTLQREKIYEALAYFAGNVRYAGTIKLFKLLYYLDLMHFRRTGRTVTGLVYNAWPMGPVPAELDVEFKNNNSELHKRFDVRQYKKIEEYETPTIDTREEDLGLGGMSPKFAPGTITPKIPYSHQFLTRREMQIAEQLAEIFREATAGIMSDVSHGKFGPWQKALFQARNTGIERPPIDLTQGIVACGKREEELPSDEFKEIVAERALIEKALM